MRYYQVFIVAPDLAPGGRGYLFTHDWLVGKTLELQGANPGNDMI
jgi:hypothetical protein